MVGFSIVGGGTSFSSAAFFFQIDLDIFKGIKIDWQKIKLC